MVEEWLLNMQDYQSFFSNASLDFEDEAEKYKNHGVFASCLGDAMLLGLTNTNNCIYINTKLVTLHYLPYTTKHWRGKAFMVFADFSKMRMFYH